MRGLLLSTLTAGVALAACAPECPATDPECVAAAGTYILAPAFEVSDSCQVTNLVPETVEVVVRQGDPCGEIVERQERTAGGHDLALTVTAYADAEGLWAGTLILAYADGTCGYSLEPASEEP